MTKSDSSSIFKQLQVDAKQKQKLKEVEKQRIDFEEETEKELSQYEENLEKMLNGQKDISVSELSKLDQGIERGKLYKEEVSELAESLTDELQGLGQFFGDMTNYTGLENLLSKVSTKLADKHRLSRVKSADVKENLQTILDYGHHMVQKLYDGIISNMECHSKIDSTIRTTSNKLDENQPKYELWRDKKETLERDLEALQERMDAADETEYATLEKDKAEIQRNLQEAVVNENNYFTIVNKAKQALPIQRQHMQAYADMIDGLTQLRTGLEQDIENVTQLYLSTPVAIQTALKTKAASQYDKGMKYATDVSTSAVLNSAKGVLDEVASRNERPLIEPDKLEAYRKLQKEMRTTFDQRTNTLKKKYAQPAAAN